MSYRLSGDGDVATEESFADALRAHFGETPPPSEAEPEPSPESEPPASVPAPEPGEGEGASPSPSPLPVEGGDEGGYVETPAELEPVEQPEPEQVDAPAPDALDLNELFERWYGVKPTAQQMTSLLSFVDQMQRLTPDQQAAINAVVSGQGLPVQPQAAPPPPPAQSVNLDQFSDDARAVLEPIVQQQNEILQRLQSQESAQIQQNLQAQEQQIVSGIQTASSAFVDQYRSVLSPTDFVILESRAHQSGQFPYLMNMHGGDSAKAYRALLETVAYSDPILREKMVAAPPPTPDTNDKARIAKASAVAAGGSAGTKMSPLTQAGESVPKDPNAARDWAINEISRVTGLPRIS